MTTMAFLGRAHYISLYVFFGICISLLLCICILIWMRKRYSLCLIPLLILLVWYTYGFGWRLGFFQYVSHICFFVGSSAENYIVINGSIPTDISQLLFDENLAEEIIRPYGRNMMPTLKMIKHTKGDEVNLQIYWIGFDKDDDELKNNEFPGWSRLLYFPWFYDGDILTYECFYDESEISLYHSIQKEYKTIKYVLLLKDIVSRNNGEIAKRINKKYNGEGCMQDLYLAARKAFSETLGKHQNEKEIDNYLKHIKRVEYFYIPRNRLKYLELLLKPAK